MEMSGLTLTTFLQSDRRSKMLAMVEGIHRRLWLKNSLKPSGQAVQASLAAEYSTRHPRCRIRVQSHRSSPYHQSFVLASFQTLKPFLYSTLKLTGLLQFTVCVFYQFTERSNLRTNFKKSRATSNLRLNDQTRNCVLPKKATTNCVFYQFTCVDCFNCVFYNLLQMSAVFYC